MNRAYKYRVYPTAEQERLLTDTFGSCWFVYNHYLALQSENHQQGKAYMNKTACNNDCNRSLKQEYPWLKQVDKFALTNAIYAQDAVYQRFFRKQGGYPGFKSRRHGRMSYTTNDTNGNIAVLAGEVKLPKLGKVKTMPLSVRRYECSCGMSIDRDLNAAINIRNRGYGIYTKSSIEEIINCRAGSIIYACGAGIRPDNRRAIGTETGSSCIYT